MIDREIDFLEGERDLIESKRSPKSIGKSSRENIHNREEGVPYLREEIVGGEDRSAEVEQARSRPLVWKEAKTEP